MALLGEVEELQWRECSDTAAAQPRCPPHGDRPRTPRAAPTDPPPPVPTSPCFVPASPPRPVPALPPRSHSCPGGPHVPSPSCPHPRGSHIHAHLPPRGCSVLCPPPARSAPSHRIPVAVPGAQQRCDITEVAAEAPFVRPPREAHGDDPLRHIAQLRGGGRGGQPGVMGSWGACMGSRGYGVIGTWSPAPGWGGAGDVGARGWGPRDSESDSARRAPPQPTSPPTAPGQGAVLPEGAEMQVAILGGTQCSNSHPDPTATPTPPQPHPDPNRTPTPIPIPPQSHPPPPPSPASRRASLGRCSSAVGHTELRGCCWVLQHCCGAGGVAGGGPSPITYQLGRGRRVARGRHLQEQSGHCGSTEKTWPHGRTPAPQRGPSPISGIPAP